MEPRRRVHRWSSRRIGRRTDGVWGVAQSMAGRLSQARSVPNKAKREQPALLQPRSDSVHWAETARRNCAGMVDTISNVQPSASAVGFTWRGFHGPRGSEEDSTEGATVVP